MFIDGIGLRADGFPGWVSGREVLAGGLPFDASNHSLPDLDILPPAERRRAVPNVKLALAVALEAVTAAGGNRANLATIFTSSAGDSRTLNEIMQVLASPTREVSPTRFHNSVHNAPAGYWHIASACREASTSISCHDQSFAAGLLEAAAQIATRAQPVLLVAYDMPYPPPLDAVRSIAGTFGLALYLSPAAAETSLARIDIALSGDAAAPSTMSEPKLEAFRIANPAARSLPLLKLLAEGRSGSIVLDYVAKSRIAISVAALHRAGTDKGSLAARAAQETAGASC